MSDSIVSLAGMTQVVEGKIWISLLEVNGLVQVDMESGVANFVGCFAKEQTDYMLHYHIITYNKKIIFVPWNVSNISIYDLEKKELRNIKIDEEIRCKIGRIYAGVSKDKFLYMISEDANGIIQFDMLYEQITDYFMPKESLENDIFSMNMKPYLFDEWIWKIDKNYIWRFNIQSKMFEQQDSFVLKNVMSVCDSELYLWIVTEGFQLYQYTKEGELVYCYELNDCLKDWKNENKCIESVFLDGKLILVFPDNSTIVKIPFVNKRLDLKNKKSSKYGNNFISIQKNVITIFEKNMLRIIDDSGEKKVCVQNASLVVREIMNERLWGETPILAESNNYTIMLETYMKYIKNCYKKNR